MIHEVYEPNRTLKQGALVWRDMLREFLDYRELLLTLVERNIRARYKQALLGAAWALITPLAALGTFVILHRTGVVTIGATEAPYAVFAIAGLAVYQIFSGGITAGCAALVESGDMIAKVNFPREVLVFAALGTVLCDLGIKLMLLLAVCVWSGFMPSMGSILALPALLPIILLTAGAALILSLLNAVYRDTAQAVGLLGMFLMFLTPVLYPITGNRTGALFFRLNPLTALVDGPRDLFLRGALSSPADFTCASVFALLVFLCGWRVFHLVETKIPERI